MSQREEVEQLTDELFRVVEPFQGYFYVSDGETFPTKAEFFERIRGRLWHGRRAVMLMQAFLRKYDELESPDEKKDFADELMDNGRNTGGKVYR